MSDSHRIHRYFLSWNRPLLPQAVEYLATDWDGHTALDLSTIVVLVPTRQSGRRLREALAGYAAEQGQAVFPPQVISLDGLIGGEASPTVASRVESLLAWVTVFREIDLAGYRAVFPVEPPERNFGWALRLAQEFIGLQTTLSEVGLHLGDVPHRVESTFPEMARWRQIAKLDRLHGEKLAALELRDIPEDKIERVETAELPVGVERIVLMATPDPRPIALKVLARHAQNVPLEIVVYAPKEEEGAFDDWGRPQPEYWAERTLQLERFEEHVQLCANPEDQVARVVETARKYAKDTGILGVGVVDPEVFPLLESALRENELAGYNPEGRTRRGDLLGQLLSGLATLAREDSFTAVLGLSRHPALWGYLRSYCGEAFSTTGFLKAMDRLQSNHLPPDLGEANRHWRGGDELKAIYDLRQRLRKGAFPENAAAVLAEIFGARQLDMTKEADTDLAEAAEAWAGVMADIAKASAGLAELSPADGWELALRLYGECVRFAEKPAHAVELQGWLELIWEDAPHLLVAGLNDGMVPDAVVGDPFLPEGLRELLGLKTNAMRFACDAYYLQAIAASRATHGRLDLLLGKTSVAGDPLKPSRLLLRCADVELPARIEFLFKDVSTAGANLAWRRAWKLRVPQVEVPSRVAVTALRSWLDCPFRFYLSRVMGMQGVDPAKSELDAMDFGTLCHAALEAMGNEVSLRDCTEAKVLRDFLLSTLDREARKRYGRKFSLPLVVQMESARQRLAHAAEVQAQIRSEGWVIQKVEEKFEVPVNGLTISGKIDRIDRHEETGAVRVLDYKTSDSPVNPAKAHLRTATDPDKVAWAVVEVHAKPKEWIDLQLPLYERAVAAIYPGAVITCGYFNLPKAVTETNVELWEDYDNDLASAAWTCVEGVTSAIMASEFWPPRELRGRELDWDDFGTLFHNGAEDSVDCENLTTAKPEAAS